jgi:hypothetical protein
MDLRSPATSLACALLALLSVATGVCAQTLRLECEDFDGPWREQTNIAGYSGRGFVVSNADGVASTTMAGTAQIPEAGTYYVWARGWEGTGFDRRWRVQVGEVLLDVTHAGLDANWFSWQKCGQVDLAAGPIELRLVDAGTSYEVADAIMLTTDPNYDPGEEERRWLVLDPDEAETMLFDEIMARTRAYGAAVPVCKTREEWEARAAEVRPRVLRALGLDPLPERTPLNARTVGETQRDGYRIQRIVFESRPGLPVTANVYVPDGDGPFPLVLCPVGHWGRGKNEPEAAARSHALAKLGTITITYDPFGQEERKIPGNGHDEHWRLVLTGHTNMSIMVWDTVRALDYMLTRDDVDPTRIACTGASGGGLNTLYYSVADERLDVAIPVVYITQWEDFFSTGAAHCPCSHVPGLGAFTNMGEITALFAPKPQMYMDAKDDPQFLTSGAERAEAQAQVPYELLGAGGNLLLRTFEGGHGYGQAMRETLYGFLAQHLLAQGNGDPVSEPDFEPLPPDSPALWCFEGGRIPESSKTVRDLAREWVEEAIAGLPSPGDHDPEETRAALVETLNPPQPAEAPVLEPVGEFTAEGLTIRRLRLQVQPGITIPALLTTAEAGAPALVVADASPEPQTARELLRKTHAAGFTALYVSPRGYGETAWNEHVVCTDNLLLGDPILGQRAHDVAAACRALKALPEVGDVPMGLLAMGPEAGLCGLFAQAMWQDFDAAAVGPVIGTYRKAFGRGIPMMAYVHRILEVADIPHVAALAAERPLMVAFPDEEMSLVEAEWQESLRRRAAVTSGVTVNEALAWLAEALKADRQR